MRVTPVAVALLLLTACPADTDPGAAGTGTTGGTSSASGIMTTAGMEADADADAEGDADADADADGTATMDDAASSGDADTASDGVTDDGMVTGGGGTPLDCGNQTYACGDGIDNDRDGLVDLMDPECTGPCDDDEGSYQTGIPGDNVDCKQDCFFDGNSGQGDDGCIWSLRCDPANPGEGIGCDYTGGNNCNNMPPNQDQDCIDFCLPFVPPGCDCFGCCIVTDAEGMEHSVFLNSPDPECSADNPEACNQCTQSDDCVNECEDCELCFGDEELPPECEENECDFGDPCTTIDDCPTDWYCLQDCCYPPPPG